MIVAGQMKDRLEAKCIAFTKHRSPCPNKPEWESKWCGLHEELQGKCMRLYKHHSRELDKFSIDNPYPQYSIPTGTLRFQTTDDLKSREAQQTITTTMIPRSENVAKIDEIETLKLWHQIARRTWALANR